MKNLLKGFYWLYLVLCWVFGMLFAGTQITKGFSNMSAANTIENLLGVLQGLFGVFIAAFVTFWVLTHSIKFYKRIFKNVK